LAASTNTGQGALVGLTLEDENAPPEVWTIRCVSVRRTAAGVAIPGTAKFFAFGSVSGALMDANGNPYTWIDNGPAVSNTVLSFSITNSSSTQGFVPGDNFTIIVSSGVLVRGDSLTSNEIPTAHINNPTQTAGMSDVINFCGSPSLLNNLSIGAQLFYANGASSLIAVQAAPPMPRRTSYIMATSVNSLSTNPDDFIFPFPLGVVPDLNSEIHFFVTSPSTQTETQILPNNLLNSKGTSAFYTLGGSISDETMLPISGTPTEEEFIFSGETVAGVVYPDTYEFDYTVIHSWDSIQSGTDGGIIPKTTSVTTANTALFGSASTVFTSSYVGKILKIVDAENTSNIGLYQIMGVSNGQLLIQTIISGEPPVEAYPMNFVNGFADFAGPVAAPGPNETEIPADPLSAGSEPFEIISIITNLPVDGYSATDGTLVPLAPFASGDGYAIVVEPVTYNPATATLYSPSIDFSALDPAIGTDGYYKIKLNDVAVTTSGTETYLNNGLFDIIGYDSGTNTLTIARSFVTESELRYEVLDPTTLSTYLVVNQAVVPYGNQLRVTIVDARDAAFYDAGWINALESLETVECDIVVPLPNQTISVIFQNALAHCQAMSNIVNRKERVLFMGAISGLTPANLTGARLAAVEDLGVIEGIPDNDITSTLAQDIQDIANYSVSNSYGETYRCVYFYPDQIFVQAGSDYVMVDGFYIAAAAAGYANADLRLENPFTNKVFSGFTIMQNKAYSALVLQQLASAGVTTLQPVAGGGRVVWGITTTQSGYPEEQEISIVFIRDRVAKVLRSGFAGFVGTPQTESTQATMTTEAIIILNSLVAQNLIQAYAGLKVVQDQVDPRQWDISVVVQPTYPINWVYISVTVTNLGV
jgi:hypothetical protein